MEPGTLVLVGGALLAAGIAATQLAGRVRLPSLLLFLATGMVLGTDGLGLISFDDYERAQAIGVIALALILFEGGLAAGWPEVRPVVVPALSLAVVGTIATAVVVALIAAPLIGLSAEEAFLLGAIVSSTDGAAVFALLKGSTLRRRLARTLEGEAGFNDPIAVLLVLAAIEAIQDPGFGLTDALVLALEEIGVGVVVGLGVGFIATYLLRRSRLPSAGAYPIASLSTAGLAYGLADVLHGSGFAAVYLCGLVLGSGALPALRTMETFHDALAEVAQLVLFLSLGLLIFPSQLPAVALEGTIIGLALVLLARPAATFLATIGFGYTKRERLALGAAGLRGAVPVVLATFPLLAGVEGAQALFNLVFFAVVVSTLLQGPAFVPLAERLGVTTSEAALPMPVVDREVLRNLGAETVEYVVGEEDAAVGARVRELGLPREALLTLVVRGDEAILPRGTTRLEAGDRLNVLARQELASDLPALLLRWRDGPLGRPPLKRAFLGSTVTTSRPWREADGDPSRPHEVAGVTVHERLRVRRDRPGCLVLLEDGRHAVCGPVLVMGPAGSLPEQCRYRIRVARDDAERGWWRDVLAEVSRG